MLSVINKIMKGKQESAGARKHPAAPTRRSAYHQSKDAEGNDDEQTIKRASRGVNPTTIIVAGAGTLASVKGVSWKLLLPKGARPRVVRPGICRAESTRLSLCQGGALEAEAARPWLRCPELTRTLLVVFRGRGSNHGSDHGVGVLDVKEGGKIDNPTSFKQARQPQLF